MPPQSKAKRSLTKSFVIAATVWSLASATFALDGHFTVHDPSTITQCGGKYYTYKELIGIYGDRQTVIDDGVSKRLTLKKGPNVVRCAILNAGGATDFCARFLDKDERPLKGFTLSMGEGAKSTVPSARK
jgi:hypothetical protein